MTPLERISDNILHELIECYFSETPFYMSNRLGKFMSEEDSTFISNEDIIDHIRQQLKGKFYLQVTKVPRVFEDFEPFIFEDTLLEIKLNEDDD